MRMSEATLVTGLKTLRKLKIIERIGQSEYLLNFKYFKYFKRVFLFYNQHVITLTIRD
mgnify:CR=1 FL=1